MRKEEYNESKIRKALLKNKHSFGLFYFKMKSDWKSYFQQKNKKSHKITPNN